MKEHFFYWSQQSFQKAFSGNHSNSKNEDVPNTRTYYDLEHLWADGEPIDISEYLTPDNSL